MNDAIKVMLTLTVTTAAAGFILAASHASTATLIASQASGRLHATQQRLFPAEARIIDTSGSSPLPSRYWIAKKDSIVIGYGCFFKVRGYSGPISGVVGIDTGATITGLVLLSQNEAPLTGWRLEDRRATKSLWGGWKNVPSAAPWFTEQFRGMSVNRPIGISYAAQWPELSDLEKKGLFDKNVISAISGATVTSRAVVDGIEKNAVSCYNALRGVR